ncbi:MAG: hypothetical protein LBU44_07335, partial [Mediterranea sp.]|nr:hypothetical protein [Mediterranea sp.]
CFCINDVELPDHSDPEEKLIPLKRDALLPSGNLCGILLQACSWTFIPSKIILLIERNATEPL